MTANLERKIKTVGALKELQKYIEDTAERVNVGIKNFILVGRC